MMSANITGLIRLINITKISQISDNVNLKKSMTIGLTETHLNSDISDAEISIDDLQIVRFDRDGTSHGGAILYVRQYLQIYHLITYNFSQCEAVTVSMKSIGPMVTVRYHLSDLTHDNFKDIV